jgi:hypothetical protein
LALMSQLFFLPISGAYLTERLGTERSWNTIHAAAKYENFYRLSPKEGYGNWKHGIIQAYMLQNWLLQLASQTCDVIYFFRTFPFLMQKSHRYISLGNSIHHTLSGPSMKNSSTVP